MTFSAPKEAAVDDRGEAPAEITVPVREALERLERDGRLTAAGVLDSARDSASPLHRCFEWDDSVAGERYRLDQARRLIRSVRVEITVEESVIATPRYVRDPAAGLEQGFVTQDQLRTEPQNAKALGRYEIARAAEHVTRAAGIAKSLNLRREFQRAKDALDDLGAKLGEGS